jgi:hypothetical protein
MLLHFTPFKKQTGAVLLALMLVLIVGSSYFLVTKLNTNLSLTRHSEETGLALNAAKNALIGYAISYPDKVNADFGPGYLLCPDKDNNGDAEGSCVLGGTNNTIGRFPYETLELEDLRDSSGQRFWYAISQNFRNNPGKLVPLNSESPASADLSVNGVGDIVAVIIAPGAPVNGQNRDPSVTNITSEISHYLEGDNNNLDTAFVTTLGGAIRKDGEYDTSGNYIFNDRLVVITRQELMQAVEKRVLGEAKQILLDFQTNHNVYPWLSPFATPSTSAFRGLSTSYRGHLPFHWANDPDSIDQGGSVVGRSPFNTSLSVSWNIIDAVLSAGTAISDEAMQDSSFNDPVYGVINPVDIANASCEWINRNSVKCTGTTNFNDPTCSSVSGTCPQAGFVSCDRSYDFNLEFLDESATTISMTDPDAANVRTRDVAVDISSLITTLTNYSIQITDNYTVKGPNPPCGSTTVSETRSLTVDVGKSTGTMTIAGIHYDLDVDGFAGLDINSDGDFDDPGEVDPVPSELPEWFLKNNWHHLVYIAYPASELIPGGAVACITATDCIELNGSGSPDDNKRALAIIAGEALSTQDRTTAPTIDDWFENENNNGDDIFEKADSSSTFNDQVRIISKN